MGCAVTGATREQRVCLCGIGREVVRAPSSTVRRRPCCLHTRRPDQRQCCGCGNVCFVWSAGPGSFIYHVCLRNEVSLASPCSVSFTLLPLYLARFSLSLSLSRSACLPVIPSLSLSLAARDALTQKANTLLLKKLGIRKRFNPSIAPPSSNFDLPETSLSLATESRCWEPGADAYCAQRYRGGRQSRRTQRFTVRSTARWPLDIMFAAPVYARARVC